MSRREFRSAVDVPRPAAAWAMVAFAGSTLWITGLLPLPIIAAQIAALGASFALRRAPHPLQRNPWALNAGLLLAVAASLVAAVRGAEATVALAWFAALMQGLQLLDARPRRSEFLLVAMALFQVLLAANLTDRIVFVPLTAGFVAATTWTLVAHTLRVEAAEAGVPHAADAVLSGRMRAAALAASAACWVLALGLFLLLPRMQGTMMHTELGHGGATSGFSDRVTLGELGRIRHDPTVVLRVETLEGRAPDPGEAYWRGLAFDHFDGRSWSVTPAWRRRVPGSPEMGLTVAPEPPVGTPLVQRIVREPVASGVIFAPRGAHRLQGTLRHLLRDANGSLYAPAQSAERVRYTVSGRRPAWSDDALANDLAAPPRGDEGRSLELPPLDPQVRALAQRLVAGARTDAERARRIEQHLRTNGRYTDRQPPELARGGRSPVEAFLLGELAGHCEYFATGMVMLARSVGLPARLVNGFAGGRENRIGGFVELTRADAHAWVEVHYARNGWVRYDPTPPDLRLRAATPPSLWDALRETASALELLWFQHVVGFDRSDQVAALGGAWKAWRKSRKARAERRSQGVTWTDDLGAWLRERRGALAALLALGAAGLLWRGRGARRGAARTLPREYAAALRLLRRAGLERGPATTARDFAGQVAGTLPPAAAGAFARLTEAYLQERFGGAPGGGRSRAALAALRRALPRRPMRRARPA